MEGIMRDRITSHLEIHKLISPSQHGFVRKKSCVTNLVVRGCLRLGLKTLLRAAPYPLKIPFHCRRPMTLVH